MFYHRALIDSRVATIQERVWLSAGVLALALAGFESLSYGLAPLPQTPCPCAADGICRPNRGSWGYSQTRWRAWPGDQISQQPTSADGPSLGDGEEQPLAPFEPPLPGEEDLRGPAKEKAKKSETGDADQDAAAANQNADENATGAPNVRLPEPEGLPPLFGPQGNSTPPVNRVDVQPMEDAPPALPASLRQAAASMHLPQRTSLQQPRAVRPPAATTSARRPIRPVGWQQPAVGLINPAAAVVESADNTLQQAIYYEDSDLRGKSAE